VEAAIVIGGLLAVAWLASIPRDFRAKPWHHVHILLIAVPIAAAFLAPPAAQGALDTLLLSGGVLLVLCLATWLIGSVLRNHSFMDIAYPLMVLGVATYGLSRSASGLSPHSLVLFGLVAIWALRLVSHAVRTNLRVEQEPYASLRKRYGSRWFTWSFFAVYALQGMILWAWCAGIVFGMSAPDGDLGPIDLLGVAVWGVGFLFQAVGDWQLKRFKADPASRGKVMQAGLWSLTRHPNYFGEAVMWTGYFLFALQHPWGWITLFSPIYVYWFMGYGSAAPGNERHMRKTRPDYDDYARRVPRMIPRLPFTGGSARG
jgi:steroid 5-alpha reductase family enzyme